MDLRERTLKSWAEFARLAEVLDPQEGSPLGVTYIFRGQANASWLLRPSLLRKTGVLPAEDVLAIEKGALEAFQLHALQHLDFATVQAATDILSWWTLMQHHGAPTRLLDWTASPHVAAYFAVEREPDNPGAIWLLHPRAIDLHRELTHGGLQLPGTRDAVKGLFLDPKAPRTLFLTRRLRETARMTAQQTSFTVSPYILADYEQIIAGIADPFEGRKEVFRKLVIPPELKPEFLRRLRRMNITAQALFPGVDGLGRSVAELVQVAIHHGLSLAKGKQEEKPR